MMKHQAGDSAGAIEAARQAIPLCLKANEGQLATELYRLHAADARSLFLDAAQLVALGDLLIAQNDPSAAANAWAHALTADAGNRKAFKGLLKIADQILQTGAALDRAIRIYDFLIQRAPDSPFADHARTQLEIARRKAAKG
jgi:tetratricopeptide (TPR) repeat protein